MKQFQSPIHILMACKSNRCMYYLDWFGNCRFCYYGYKFEVFAYFENVGEGEGASLKMTNIKKPLGGGLGLRGGGQTYHCLKVIC